VSSATAKNGRPVLPWWGAVGVAVLAGGLFLLVRDVERWNAIWYVPAWYGYLLLVDALAFRLQGRSFVGGRLRELGAMMFWSVPFWFLFEAYNLRLENWYYVFALRNDLAGAAFGALAFATVLPACFLHAELLRALGLFRSLRWRPLRVGRGVLFFCATLGVLSIAAPLLVPRYAFWLLADLEKGRAGRIARLAAGGLCAGLVWETFNYWARCKWIYTVPGFESAKLLEMPIAGFAGFPLLALEAFACFSLISHFLRGARHREESESCPRRPVPRGRLAAAVATALLASGVTYWAALSQTVASRRPLLAELAGLDGDAAGRLRAAGIPTPERLHGAARREGANAVARRAGLPPARIEQAARHASLALHKGMGARPARLLQSVGVESVAQLARADPNDLARRLEAAARASGHVSPPRAQVRVWVEAARITGETRR
jgi:predicted flap endonuclease-1-like 5' DNA nuclease